MNYITGDTHGDYRQIAYSVKQKKLNKADRLFVCGDFSFIWEQACSKYFAREEERIDGLSSLGPEILFIDGNHENFNRLLEFPEINLYGGKVGQIRNNIFHLKRGYVYTIDGKKIFTMGGGISIDKHRRVAGLSWWPQEMHTKAEQDFAIDNLEKNKWQVDFVLSHTSPLQAEPLIQEAMAYADWEYGIFKLDALQAEGKFLTEVCNKLDFKEWHFGHFHEDFSQGKFYLHYTKIKKFF
jgi:predicted phosphodiesterase